MTKRKLCNHFLINPNKNIKDSNLNSNISLDKYNRKYLIYLGWLCENLTYIYFSKMCLKLKKKLKAKQNSSPVPIRILGLMFLPHNFFSMMGCVCVLLQEFPANWSCFEDFCTVPTLRKDFAEGCVCYYFFLVTRCEAASKVKQQISTIYFSTSLEYGSIHYFKIKSYKFSCICRRTA